MPSGMLCAPAMSSTVNAINSRVPASARGEAMGLHGTALTVGGALAGPIVGGLLDAHGPAAAFAASGAVGVLLVLLALPFWRQAREPAGPDTEPAREPAGRLAA
jgi:MFS family permease